jgi:hypothetical protein
LITGIKQQYINSIPSTAIDPTKYEELDISDPIEVLIEPEIPQDIEKPG